MKKIISILLVLVWMILIFNFSQDDGEKSTSLSDQVVEKVVVTVTDIKKDTKEMNNIKEKYTFLIRKTAHFFLYFVLGILVANCLYNFNVKSYLILYAGIICVLYAIFDEIHQLFIDGRSGSIKDVLLDSSASFFALYLFSKVYLLRGKYDKKKL